MASTGSGASLTTTSKLKTRERQALPSERVLYALLALAAADRAERSADDRRVRPTEEILCSAGLSFSEYDRMRVRQCGAGRSRIICGPRLTGRS